MDDASAEALRARALHHSVASEQAVDDLAALLEQTPDDLPAATMRARFLQDLAVSMKPRPLGTTCSS